jgi:hypothetical protein
MTASLPRLGGCAQQGLLGLSKWCGFERIYNLHVFGQLTYLLYLPLLTAHIFLHVHTLRNDCLKLFTILRNIVFFYFR